MCATALALLAAPVAQAQQPQAQQPQAQQPQDQKTQATQDSGRTLEEIIVTSERRSENLQDVPVAVSVLGATYMDRNTITDFQQVAQRVPSFTFSDFAPGQSVSSIRGVSSTDDGAGTDSSIAIFVDDVYLGRLSNQAIPLFDVERIEVLRGPQGTLYGKNAIGGAINVITTRPSTDDMRAKLKVDVGNLRRIDTAGLVSGPITDKLAAKVSFTSRNRKGWVRNVVTGNRVRNKDISSGRAQLLYHGDRLSLLFSGDIMVENQNGIGRIPVRDGAAPIVEWHLAAGGNQFNRSTNAQDGFSRRRAYGTSLEATMNFDAGELISISAYRESKSRWDMDSVGVPQINVVDDIDDFTDQYSQEFRWSSTIGESIDYLVGLYYLNERTDRTEQFHLVFGIDDRLRAGPAGNGGGPFGFFDPDDDVDFYRQVNKTNSYAAFSHVKWAFAERWTAEVGLRFTYETKAITTDARAGQLGLFGIIRNTFVVGASKNWSDISPKFVLTHQLTDDVHFYGSVTKGFKSGGFAAAPSTIEDATRPLAPETAWNYEFGMKGDFFDNILRLNLAGYYTDYTNLQFQRFGPPLNAPAGEFGRFQTLNAGNARIKGIEAEFTFLPFEGASISGGYSYLDAKYKNFVFVDQVGNLADVSGQRLVRAPKHKFVVNLDYRHDGPLDGTLSWHFDWRYTSTQRGDVASSLTNQPKFDVAAANIVWESEDTDWAFTLWGRNLFNEKYISHIYIIGPGDIAVFGEPRMYGASLTWRYN